jgi:hypothetical protein
MPVLLDRPDFEVRLTGAAGTEIVSCENRKGRGCMTQDDDNAMECPLAPAGRFTGELYFNSAPVRIVLHCDLERLFTKLGNNMRVTAAAYEMDRGIPSFDSPGGIVFVGCLQLCVIGIAE